MDYTKIIEKAVEYLHRGQIEKASILLSYLRGMEERGLLKNDNLNEALEEFSKLLRR